MVETQTKLVLDKIITLLLFNFGNNDFLKEGFRYNMENNFWHELPNIFGAISLSISDK